MAFESASKKETQNIEELKIDRECEIDELQLLCLVKRKGRGDSGTCRSLITQSLSSRSFQIFVIAHTNNAVLYPKSSRICSIQY